MRCPTLSELPPSPPGKTGWPWTEESERLPDTMPDGRPWPRVSIATPSYNQGRFIEESIRSVLLQGYPDLEYIVIDGGSTDNTVEVIRRYEHWIAYWVSEPDRGQSHAINKGITRAGGDILAWLNSDDTYEPAVLQLVAQTLEPTAGTHVVFGDCRFTDEQGTLQEVYRGIDQPFVRKLCYWRGWEVPQPTVFATRHIIEEVGLLNESLHLGLDYEWFLRMSQLHPFTHLGRVIARYRMHSSAKSGDYGSKKHQFHDEMHPYSRQYWHTLPFKPYCRLRASYLRYRVIRASNEGRAWARCLRVIAGWSKSAMRHMVGMHRRRRSQVTAGEIGGSEPKC